MGSPILAILAEVFIQYMEHKYIYPVLRTRKIMACYRYVDDMLIIYDQRETNIEQTLEKLQPTIKFTIEKEQKEKRNYLDIAIHRKNERLEF
jgi:hypothetical protein